MVQRLNTAIDSVVKDDEVEKRLLDVGWANAEGARTPEAITRLAKSERERWGEIVREAGVLPQ
jgi:tripartite-type tricarboxylate transporter receptor subunit TctC